MTRRMAGLAAWAAASMAFAAGCEPRPTGLLVPSAIQYTPVALVAGSAGVPTALATATPSAAPTRLVAPPEPIQLPPDFHASVFAEGLGPVRALARSPNGDVFASVPRFGQLLVLPDRDADGVADAVHVYHEGPDLRRPVGMAFKDGYLYVAATNQLLRFDYRPGDLQASGTPVKVLDLPADGDHWARPMVDGGDGYLYLGVGSGCDLCREEDARRATILRVDAGGKPEIFGLGARDVGGLAVQPLTGALWATDNESSGRSAPSELNLVTAGANLGWPDCFGDRQVEPAVRGDPAKCAASVPPAVPLQGRSEPQGLAFAATERLPGAWRDDLFVAFHGNSDTGLPVGYKVGRVVFEGGVPTGEVMDFATGWLLPDTRRWGRPTDLLFAADGALLIADDGGERVYRVTYDPPTPTPTPIF